MAMDTDTIPELLGDLRDSAPDELQGYFIDFEDYWERKLWHELTDKLLEYFSKAESGDQRIPLFDTFIKSFANKINQLKLVELGLSTVDFRGMILHHGSCISKANTIQMRAHASISSHPSQSWSTSLLHKMHTSLPQSLLRIFNSSKETWMERGKSWTSASRYWIHSTRWRTVSMRLSTERVPITTRYGYGIFPLSLLANGNSGRMSLHHTTRMRSST
jgi:hypothetical protein